MSYFLENEEAVKEQEILQDETSVQQENEQDGIASIEPLLDNRIVRAIREMGKQYRISAVVSVAKDALYQELVSAGVIKGFNYGYGKCKGFIPETGRICGSDRDDRRMGAKHP